MSNVGQVITYTDTASPSEHITVNMATGEFTTSKKLKTATFLIAAQIGRASGGGIEEWGMYFEIFNGTTWEVADDSTRYFTFRVSDTGDINHLSYTLAVSDLPKGMKFRLKQICSDANDTVGILTSKPFVNAPLSAGIIVSVQTVG